MLNIYTKEIKRKKPPSIIQWKEAIPKTDFTLKNPDAQEHRD